MGTYALYFSAGAAPVPTIDQLVDHLRARRWYRVDDSALYEHKPDSVYAWFHDEDVGTTLRVDVNPRPYGSDDGRLVSMYVDAGQPHIAAIDVEREAATLAERFGMRIAYPDRDVEDRPYERARLALSIRRAMLAWNRAFRAMRSKAPKYFLPAAKLEAMAAWNERSSPKIRLYVHPSMGTACTGIVSAGPAAVPLPPVDLVIEPSGDAPAPIPWGWCHADDLEGEYARSTA